MVENVRTLKWPIHTITLEANNPYHTAKHNIQFLSEILRFLVETIRNPQIVVKGVMFGKIQAE